jgi:hypothetical protein
MDLLHHSACTWPADLCAGVDTMLDAMHAEFAPGAKDKPSPTSASPLSGSPATLISTHTKCSTLGLEANIGPKAAFLLEQSSSEDVSSFNTRGVNIGCRHQAQQHQLKLCSNDGYSKFGVWRWYRGYTCNVQDIASQPLCFHRK